MEKEPPKYINTKDVVRLTGLSTRQVYTLIHNGTLKAHRAPKSGWRLNRDRVEEYFGINVYGVVPKEDTFIEIPYSED